MRHYDELAQFDHNGYTVIVDKTWEDIPLRDCFDESCYDIKDMERRVNSYDLDWFMLRVRVLVDGHELSSSHLGGCLYEDARQVLEDGTADDLIYEAVRLAEEEARRLVGSLQRVIDIETA